MTGPNLVKPNFNKFKISKTLNKMDFTKKQFAFRLHYVKKLTNLF
jgi:hypothetical protein